MLRQLSVAVTLVTGSALAWGPEGHEVVGAIAEQHLTPAAQREVRKLLGDTNLGAREVSSWADGWRLSHHETGRWHFVDIPLERAAYEPAADCRRGECVVAKIPAFVTQLRDSSLTEDERRVALKFVVHLVGDLHQPLHCEDDGDAGGNDVEVSFGRRRTKLHAVWDGQVLRELLARGDVAAYASALDGRAGGGDTAGGPAEWATESHQVAQAIYAELGRHPSSRELSLPRDYTERNRARLELQLVRAGRRLATVLNAAFAVADH